MLRFGKNKSKRTLHLRKRHGITLIEMVFSMAVFVVIVMFTAQISQNISGLKNRTTDTVYLSMHNLNVMERIRQWSSEPYGDLLLYYGDDEVGTTDIQTSAELVKSTCGTFNIYEVKITSKMRANRTRLVTTYVVTDIGGTRLVEEINPS